MELIADGLLIATALTAALYCLVLSRRLRNLSDSGSGIGAQIEALDRALNETRGALAETREGVGELRASAKSSLAKLARESALATDLASRLESGAARAEATMQRLYQAETRVAAYQTRLDGGGDTPGPGKISVASLDDAEGAAGLAAFRDRDFEGEADESGAGGAPGDDAIPTTMTTRVQLPDGASRQVVAPVERPGAEDSGPEEPGPEEPGPEQPGPEQSGLKEPDPDDARDGPAVKAGRSGQVLKAERMML